MNPGRPHELWAVTAADRARLAAHVDALSALAPPGTRVRGVVDARTGNLGGTLAAWAAIRRELGPGERAAILHDGGQATRTAAITGATGGSRGALDLGATHMGRPVDQLGLVALTMAPWADDPARVDVFWGSQLVLPDRVEPASGHLCKLGRPTADVDPEGLADLGWLAADDAGRAVGFAPRGRLPDPVSWRSWAAGRAVCADLGSASLSRALLDALLELYAAFPARKRDLDPDLTDPWVRALSGDPGPGPADAEIRALIRDPRFADPGAVRVRPFAGAWVRLRRPEEVRRALVEVVPRDPRLRALFGVDHPVERAVLGGVRVEGPELTFADVDAGVEVGGVALRGAIVRDGTLDAGSRVQGGWVARVEGRLDVEGSAAIDVRRPARLRGELAIDEHRAHPGALDRLARLASPGSDAARLVALLASGALALGRGPADGPPTALWAPKGASRGVLRVRADLWRDGARQAELALDGWARHLGDPGPAGRDALADGLPGLDALDPGPLPAARDALERAVAAWSPDADPLRARLGGLLAGLDRLPPAAIADLDALRAAWRVALEHRRQPLIPAWTEIGAHLVPEALARWQQAGEVFPVGPSWLPTPPRPAPAGSLDEVVRALRPGMALGIAGPAAAGKTTLADRLAAALGPVALRVSGDELTWAGDGFRYAQRPSWRDERVEGPGVYDDRALLARIRAAKDAGRTALVDGVFLGLEPLVRDALDALVALAPDPARAWAAKSARDSAPGSGRVIDLASDFARKLFREHTDALPRLARHARVRLDASPP